MHAAYVVLDAAHIACTPEGSEKRGGSLFPLRLMIPPGKDERCCCARARARGPLSLGHRDAGRKGQRKAATVCVVRQAKPPASPNKARSTMRL